MAKEKNTKIHNIFLVSKEKVQEKYFSGKKEEVEKLIAAIMGEDAEYKKQALKPLPKDNFFNVELYFKEDFPIKSRLASFCAPFVRDDQEIMNFQTKNASSVLFVWSEKNIFAITTGQGFRMVEEFCAPKFGLIVISMFENLFRITALDSNGMSSIVHSNKTIYSNEVDFANVESLDTVFKEVTGRLNSKEKVRELFNLGEDSKKKSVKITGKNYVQFSSSMNFNILLHLLSILDEYDFSQMKESFNLIVPLNSKTNREDIIANQHRIIEILYEHLGKEGIAPFDVFHKDTINFIEADSYSIVYDGIDAPLATTDDIDPNIFINDAYSEFLQDKSSSIDTFSDFVYGAKVVAYKGDIAVACDLLLNHISGEIERDGKNYYIFYGEFYYLSDSYSERLNRSLKGKLTDDRYSKILTTTWETNDKEDDFNKKASIEGDLIHLHKVKPEYIEFADLMKVEENAITLIHVKDGFDCDMRALDRQIELSVTRVIDAKNNNNVDYLRELYTNACKNTVGKNISSVFASADQFTEAIIHRNVRFVVAIHPPKADLLSNGSNIAKHCLNAMILRCFNQGIDLKINIINDK